MSSPRRQSFTGRPPTLTPEEEAEEERKAMERGRLRRQVSGSRSSEWGGKSERTGRSERGGTSEVKTLGGGRGRMLFRGERQEQR
jgi:hypothetical protein